MSLLLDNKDFGEKLYNTLPPRYREDDALVNFALKRYLTVLADGGFAKVIDELNGLLNLVDPDKVDSKILPILFSQYGLEIFNGIPELYLRKLLPYVNYLFSQKGSITPVEFLTTLVSGVKTEISIGDNTSSQVIRVNLEVDYGKSENNTVPDRRQLIRIIREFVPFFCDVTIVYVYFFLESLDITVAENEEFLKIYNLFDDLTYLKAEEETTLVLKDLLLKEKGDINKNPDELMDFISYDILYDEKSFIAGEQYLPINITFNTEDLISFSKNSYDEILNIKETLSADNGLVFGSAFMEENIKSPSKENTSTTGDDLCKSIIGTPSETNATFEWGGYFGKAIFNDTSYNYEEVIT